MHIHILGICGTFMSGLAILAKELGHKVSGTDFNVYPPMSTQLQKQGIVLHEGFTTEVAGDVDCFIVGNVVKRGNPLMEHILNQQLPYVSGPQWLREHILKDRWVLAVAGTHGKTTTTSLLAWILQCADKNPGYLIGGVPENFGVSAALGSSPYFVIEADEYDSAFFDKRSKFIHYAPKTLVLNNLEFDHADIFPNLESIKMQFHHLIKTIPGNGMIIHNGRDDNITDVLSKGCWSECVTFNGPGSLLTVNLSDPAGSRFEIISENKIAAEVCWDLVGDHNVQNAMAAITAAQHIGIPIETSAQALKSFKNVKRRLEVISTDNSITIYDDFAHHPTAIKTTLNGLRARIGKARLIVILEFGSYTMRTGVHKLKMQEALNGADMVFCKAPEVDWGLQSIIDSFKQPATVFNNVSELLQTLIPQLKPNDHIIIMSNGGFEGIHIKLQSAIKTQSFAQVESP